MILQKQYTERQLHLLEKELDYKFNSLDLLFQALKHPSMTNESNALYSYEKLEFLGDKTLNLIIAEKLFEIFANDNEGILSLRLNYLISGEVIFKIAKKINLGYFIEMSFSERQTNGESKKNNLENCMEAVIGAIYLDSGIEDAKKTALNLWSDFLSEASNVQKDAKSQLQEWLQKHKFDLPQYNLTERFGPDHSPIFKAQLIAANFPKFEGIGRSLKEAQTKAAESAIEYIKNMNKIY
jgi:ribonuclease-3